MGQQREEEHDAAEESKVPGMLLQSSHLFSDPGAIAETEIEKRRKLLKAAKNTSLSHCHGVFSSLKSVRYM